MNEIQLTDKILIIRIGKFQLKIEKIREEGGVEVLKKWLQTNNSQEQIDK